MKNCAVNFLSMPRIFISRELPSPCAFREILSPIESIIIQDESLIHFIPIPFNDIATCDWIFFCSKNAVSFFFPQMKLLKLKVPIGVKWGAIGLGTSKELLKNQIHADFSGNGRPEEVGIAFLPFAKNKSILFPSAKNSKESIQQIILQYASKVINLPIYDNIPKQNFHIENSDLYIFTSPLNVYAFSQKYTLTNKNCIAIGNTTSKELEKSGVLNLRQSPFPTEESLAQTAFNWLKKT